MYLLQLCDSLFQEERMLYTNIALPIDLYVCR